MQRSSIPMKASATGRRSTSRRSLSMSTGRNVVHKGARQLTASESGYEGSGAVMYLDANEVSSFEFLSVLSLALQDAPRAHASLLVATRSGGPSAPCRCCLLAVKWHNRSGMIDGITPSHSILILHTIPSLLVPIPGLLHLPCPACPIPRSSLPASIKPALTCICLFPTPLVQIILVDTCVFRSHSQHALLSFAPSRSCQFACIVSSACLVLIEFIPHSLPVNASTVPRQGQECSFSYQAVSLHRCQWNTARSQIK